MRLRALLLVAACVLAPVGGEAAGTRQVTGFGPNLGDLLMFEHVPDRLPAGAPLVVALHGCSQKAELFDDESGWAGLADRLGFALLLPQQQAANNPDLCFNFFRAADNRRGQGEAASIAAMIGAAQARHGTDPKRVYVTGLSAGGAMTAVMLASYPELFAGGAILAGLPYGCADTAGDPPLSPWPAWRQLLTFWYGEAGWAAWACGIGSEAGLPSLRERTPEAWAALARSAAGASPASWPKVSLWHGTADRRVDARALDELAEQWAALHGIDRAAVDEPPTPTRPYRYRAYQDAQGEAQVESFLVEGLPHALPVDPGPDPEQCGKAGGHFHDADLCAAWHIVRFWGLAPPTG
jgi:poly(3-hydroxybutyrate) depolymerase